MQVSVTNRPHRALEILQYSTGYIQIKAFSFFCTDKILLGFGLAIACSCLHVKFLLIHVHMQCTLIYMYVRIELCVQTLYYQGWAHTTTMQQHAKLELSRAHTPCVLQPLQHSIEALQLVQNSLHDLVILTCVEVKHEHGQLSHVSTWSGCGR